MVATGLLQIFIAGLDIFAACWKLFKPLYLVIILVHWVTLLCYKLGCALIAIMIRAFVIFQALSLACSMLILDIVAISTCSWICIESHLIVTEDVLYAPWYEWDCLPHGSCKMGMMYYVECFVVPQIGLAVVSGVLQVRCRISRKHPAVFKNPCCVKSDD